MHTSQNNSSASRQEDATIQTREIILSSEEYAALRERVTSQVFDAIESIFAKEGLLFDRAAFLAQASYDQPEVLNQLLVLGCNVSVGEDDPQAPEREPVADNVVSLEGVREKRANRVLPSPAQIAARLPFDLRRLAMTAAMVAMVPAYSFADVNADGFLLPEDFMALADRMQEPDHADDHFHRTFIVNGQRVEMALRRVSATEYEVVRHRSSPHNHRGE
jgi:hypothetical protein